MDGNHPAELAVYLLKGLGVPDFPKTKVIAAPIVISLVGVMAIKPESPHL